MTTTTIDFAAFARSTSSSDCPSCHEDDDSLADPNKRALLQTLRIVRRTTRRDVAFGQMPAKSSECGTEALLAFAHELGLEEHLSEARRELHSQLAEAGECDGLRSLRLSAGLSQSALAALLGTSQARISNIESGREGMRLSFAMRMAKSLDVTVDRLGEIMGLENGD